MNTRIINYEFCASQARYLAHYISTESASDLPTEIQGNSIAYGSTAILPDGIYFYFPDDEWKKLGE